MGRMRGLGQNIEYGKYGEYDDYGKVRDIIIGEMERFDIFWNYVVLVNPTVLVRKTTQVW